MAEVNDMFDDITKEQSFFNPNSDKCKKKYIPLVKGEYFGHIVEVTTKVLDVKGGKYRARLYNYVVESSKENAETLTVDAETQKPVKAGDSFVGKKFRGNLWRFLEPKEGDDFESNSEGNTAYLRFCENIGKECPKETKSIDGQDIEVQLLPTLSTEDFLGQPVIAFVDKGRPFTDKEGKTRQYFDCKFCKKWEGGTKKDISSGGSNEIPF